MESKSKEDEAILVLAKTWGIDVHPVKKGRTFTFKHRSIEGSFPAQVIEEAGIKVIRKRTQYSEEEITLEFYEVEDEKPMNDSEFVLAIYHLGKMVGRAKR